VLPLKKCNNKKKDSWGEKNGREGIKREEKAIAGMKKEWTGCRGAPAEAQMPHSSLIPKGMNTLCSVVPFLLDLQSSLSSQSDFIVPSSQRRTSGMVPSSQRDPG
jgi:hypothetical protein